MAGKCLTWDVTIADTLAASYLASTSLTAGSAAGTAATKKIAKYTDLSRSHIFCPLAFESLGPINVSGQSFLAELGRRLTATTGDTSRFYSSAFPLPYSAAMPSFLLALLSRHLSHLVTRDQYFLLVFNFSFFIRLGTKYQVLILLIYNNNNNN